MASSLSALSRRVFARTIRPLRRHLVAPLEARVGELEAAILDGNSQAACTRDELVAMREDLATVRKDLLATNSRISWLEDQLLDTSGSARP